MKRLFYLCIAAGILVSAFAPWSPAEEGENPVTKIVLHPAPEPRPALKYRFVFPVGQRRPGNAILLYDRIYAERFRVFGAKYEVWEELHKWSEAPLADLRSDKARKAISGYGGIVKQLDEAARCKSCDWQLLTPGQPFWEILLPDVQSSRAFARILAPYVRLQMAEGKYDDAVESFRSGYLLAQNVGRGPCLVCSLVGSAIAGIMNNQLEQFIQLPDSPNLYWALSTLPRPLIDFRPAWEAEWDSIYLSIPELRDLDKKQYPPEFYSYLLKKIIEQCRELFSMEMDGTERSLSNHPDLWQLAITAFILEGYPRAKQYLIGHGRSAAEVEAMPVPQVVLLYTMQFYDELRDDLSKWAFLPYAEGWKHMEKSEKRLNKIFRSRSEIIPLASVLLPALCAVKKAEARIERNVAALQVLEALRLYAAAHDGKLPDRLADVTEVPVPRDPFTGQPFIYHREGKYAFLDSFGPNSRATLRYQIEMRRKGEKP